MKIAAIEAFALKPRIIKEAWVDDEYVWPSTPPCVIVKVTAEDGTYGIGEVTSQTWYLGETTPMLVSIVEAFAKALKAQDENEFYFAPRVGVDDVELYFPPNDRVIHVRSAARLGLLDSGQNRERAYALIRSQVGAGRQAFVIYPPIEESETSETPAAVEEHSRLQKESFPSLRLALLAATATAVQTIFLPSVMSSTPLCENELTAKPPDADD